MSTEVYRPEWPRLLNEALTMPGGLGNVYNRFYTYSLTNQMLIYLQGVREPVNTYRRWQDMNRQVKKGSKAKSILHPMFRKELQEDGTEQQRLTGFRLVNCLFTLSETEGDELPEYVPPHWSLDQALGALSIHRIAFDEIDGNTQGYSIGNEFAINPVAKYPLKTTAHEMGHIVIGHTAPAAIAQYGRHRGIREFQAEGTAHLVMNEIVTDGEEWGASESRAYIQTWLQGKQPDDNHIRQVFTAADKIINAGKHQNEPIKETS